jgi:hypothetical protein
MILTRGRMAILALLIAFLVFVGSFACYQQGLLQGKKEGAETASIRANYLRAQNTCVYLALAMSHAQAGRSADADRHRDLLLFGSALDIQEALDSVALERAGIDRADAERVLKGVAEIFWRNPASINILDGDVARAHLKPKLQAVFDRYKPGV